MSVLLISIDSKIKTIGWITEALYLSLLMLYDSFVRIKATIYYIYSVYKPDALLVMQNTRTI